MLKQQKTENPMSAGKIQALRVTFDSRLKPEFHGSKVTSDAGLLACRELAEAVGLTDLGEDLLNDWRTGKKPATLDGRAKEKCWRRRSVCVWSKIGAEGNRGRSHLPRSQGIRSWSQEKA